MSAPKKCEVCQRPAGHMNDEWTLGTCARAAIEYFFSVGDPRAYHTECYRLGYALQRARAENAEQERDEIKKVMAAPR